MIFFPLESYKKCAISYVVKMLYWILKKDWLWLTIILLGRRGFNILEIILAKIPYSSSCKESNQIEVIDIEKPKILRIKIMWVLGQFLRITQRSTMILQQLP